jgi:transposase
MGVGQPVTLSVANGETLILNKIFYKGKVFVNVIGVWQKGFSDPMWIMTNLKAEDGLAIYLQRMKIEEIFRDLKSLLNFHKIMRKRRIIVEKMAALLLIAYAIALILGETVRTQLFLENCRKQELFSRPFIFLKLRPDLSPPVLSPALSTFSLTVCPIRTHV